MMYLQCDSIFRTTYELEISDVGFLIFNRLDG